jgi:peptide deformylase
MNLDEFDPASLRVITFPHPTLRYNAKPIKRVDALLRKIVSRMFELMYEHRGVGLAATQVNLPIRLFVMNSVGDREEGVERAFINPVISRPRSNEEAEEGCLSLPNVHGNVVRAKTIHINAFDLSGKEVDEDVSGFEARIIQHETDHLNGMLFIDRMNEGATTDIVDELDSLATDFRSRQRTAAIRSDDELIAELAAWESRYCV